MVLVCAAIDQALLAEEAGPRLRLLVVSAVGALTYAGLLKLFAPASLKELRQLVAPIR